VIRIVRRIVLAPEQAHIEPVRGRPRLRERRCAHAAIDRTDLARETTGGA